MRVLAALVLAAAFLAPSTMPDPSPGELAGCDAPGAGFAGGYLGVGVECPGNGGDGDGPVGPIVISKPVDPWVAICAAYEAVGRDCVRVIDNRPGVPAVGRVITIEDLAAFTPIVGELVVEPEGWGVVGTPTNFYATAETHTMDGELFDTAIQVRWTPSSYRFDYGDGAVEETQASGSAWSGVEESWTETTTSHTYAAREDVTASVTVIFTAEVNAGSGWFAVPGSLPVAAPGVTVKVFEVDTVLTDGDCMADPSAAGCG